MSSTPITTTITACRACGSGGLVTVLDLGSTPLANSLLTAEQLADHQPLYPLRLVLCPVCSLLQITETVPPETLFRHYLYRSSFSDQFLRHAQAIAERLVQERRLSGRSLVVEVASNDGYLLQYYRQAGIPVLGIEPAENIARIAIAERGIPTISEFFGSALAARLVSEGRRADVIHANNVLAHVADLNGFVAGFRHLLKDDGVVVSESPYALEFIAHGEFDTIYHEHLCYYSLTALARLFAKHDLEIVDAEPLPVHGGSLRIFAMAIKAGRKPSVRVQALLAEEARIAVCAPETYRDFAERVATIRRELVGELASLKQQGRRIAAYGAAAKGSTLLSYCGIDEALIDFVADRSPHKQGRFMPGTRIPIVAPEEILKRMPDHLLLLAWNFSDEIMRQQAAYRDRGGHFIVPIPQLRRL